MEKLQVVTEEHHRRPTSLDGSSNPGNLSYVKGVDHRNWHTMVGNMNAFQIADFINHLDESYKPENLIVECKFINGTQVRGKGKGNNSKNKKKIANAWTALFGEFSFTESIAWINNIWLDPSYHLYVKEKE